MNYEWKYVLFFSVVFFWICVSRIFSKLDKENLGYGGFEGDDGNLDEGIEGFGAFVGGRGEGREYKQRGREKWSGTASG